MSKYGQKLILDGGITRSFFLNVNDAGAYHLDIYEQKPGSFNPTQLAHVRMGAVEMDHFIKWVISVQMGAATPIPDHQLWLVPDVEISEVEE